MTITFAFFRFAQEDFRERVSSSGVKYLNLYEYLNSKAKEGLIGDQEEIKEAEFRDALI